MQNNWYKNYERGTIASMAIMLIVALIVFYFCAVNMWIDDDLTYQYHCYGANFGIWVPIKTIGDVFESQYWHYIFVNGRYVAHWIVQLFEGVLGQTAFAIANGIIYILLIRVLMLWCKVAMSNWRGVLTISCLVLTCMSVRMQPAFQMYIWMYLLVLVFLRIFFYYRTRKWWMLVLLCLFSVICGNAHESINPSIVVGLGVYIAFHIRKTTWQQWLMFTFFCIGLGTVVFSSSTQTRMVDTCPWELEWRLLALYSFLRSELALAILFFVVLYKWLIQKVNMKALIKDNAFWWVIWGANMLIALYWGFSGGRAILGEEVSAIILVIRMLKHHRFTNAWLVILTAFTFYFIGIQYGKINHLRDYFKEIERQAKANPDGNIYIDFEYSRPVLALEDYSGQVENVAYRGIIYYERYMDNFSKHFTKKWGVNHDIRTYPTPLRPYIEGKVDTATAPNKGNLLVEYAPDKYLFVRNKKHPAQLMVKYERDIPFMHKDYEPIPFSIESNIYEDDIWEATVTEKYHYYLAYPGSFLMIPPKD